MHHFTTPQITIYATAGRATTVEGMEMCHTNHIVLFVVQADSAHMNRPPRKKVDGITVDVLICHTYDKFECILFHIAAPFCELQMHHECTV